MDKPDCYKCIHRGNVPGDAHSCCQHPTVSADPLDSLMAMFGVGGSSNTNELNIVGNPHGVKSGWFMWPLNFDPVWLENCDGFEPKE